MTTQFQAFCRKTQEAAVLALCLATGMVLPITLVSLGFQIA